MVMAKSCRCNCGYRCGGLGRLQTPKSTMLSTNDGNHFVVDCDHKWDGPMVDFGNGQSVTCSVCGMLAIAHDMAFGP
jgi:hypothetical protein